MKDQASAGSKIRVLLALPRRASVEEVRGFLHATPDMEVVGIAPTAEDAVCQALQKSAHVVIIGEELGGDQAYWDVPAAIAFLRFEVRGTATILLSRNGVEPPKDDDRLALADKVLPRNATPEELFDAVRKLGTREVWTVPKQRQVIAVTAAKGGVGKTTVACNLSVALAMSEKEDEVALFDLYTQYGSSQRVLGVRAAASALDLSGRLAEADTALLEAHMATHESGLRLLVGSRDTVGKEALHSFAGRILCALRQHYTYVVLDMPNELSDTVKSVLPLCDRVLLVTNLNECTTVGQTVEMHANLVSEGVNKDEITILFNRHCRRNRLPMGEIERALAGSSFFSLPEDRGVNADNNRGVPTVFSRPYSRFARDMRRFAESLAKQHCNVNGENGR